MKTSNQSLKKLNKYLNEFLISLIPSALINMTSIQLIINNVVNLKTMIIFLIISTILIAIALLLTYEYIAKQVNKDINEVRNQISLLKNENNNIENKLFEQQRKTEYLTAIIFFRANERRGKIPEDFKSKYENIAIETEFERIKNSTGIIDPGNLRLIDLERIKLIEYFTEAYKDNIIKGQIEKEITALYNEPFGYFKSNS